MVTYNTIQSDSDRYLEYIGKHKRAFEIYEDLYPLKLFENYVQIKGFVQTQGRETRTVGCNCSIEKDILYPARFGFGFPSYKEAQVFHNPQKQLEVALNFFRQVESRAEVKLNYQLIQQFFGAHPDFRGVYALGVGLDARPEITNSRLKLYITLKNAQEKVETAIGMCGDSPTLRAFLVNDMMQVGFDLFLDGRTEIELYSVTYEDELRRTDIQSRITPLLPPLALPLLDQCEFFQVGISPANESNMLYFNFSTESNNLIDNLGNELAKKVHAYYRHQPFQVLQVGIPEKEFYSSSIEKVKLYYFFK
jgi:LynF/TruF/PatF family peptide O-prenyltransferase